MNEPFENIDEVKKEEKSSFENDYIIIDNDESTTTIFDTIDRIKSNNEKRKRSFPIGIILLMLF